MKKTILTLAMIFAIGGTIFAGAAVPAYATIGPEENGTVYYYEDADDGALYTTYDEATTGRFATVEGTKHFLALRTDPSYDDRNIVGELHNGDTVEVLDQYSGDYVWVYSEKVGCSGWVNANYLAY